MANAPLSWRLLIAPASLRAIVDGPYACCHLIEKAYARHLALRDGWTHPSHTILDRHGGQGVMTVGARSYERESGAAGVTLS